MANTTGLVKVLVRVIPEETVASTTQSSIWSNIRTVENTLCPTMNALTYTESVTFSDTGKTAFGYLNGASYYRQVGTSSSAVLGNDITNVEVAFFKHSGFRFSSESDGTCDTVNTDATVTCVANDFIEIGMEVSGAGIVTGSTVASINTGTALVDVTSFELSVAADATATDVSLKFLDHAKTSTTVSTDSLEIRGGAADGFVIAVLAPGEAIVLPVKSSTDWSTVGDRVSSDDYFFQSVDSDDIDDAGGNDIAMEFFCATAS